MATIFVDRKHPRMLSNMLPKINISCERKNIGQSTISISVSATSVLPVIKFLSCQLKAHVIDRSFWPSGIWTLPPPR